MTDVATMCESHCGGWEVISKNQIDNTFILTVSTVSVDPCEYDNDLHTKLHEGMSSHSHRKIIKTELITFDHDPTDSEIESELISLGFNPVIQSCVYGSTFAFSGNVELKNNNTVQKTTPIKTVTDGEDDVFEYSRILHPVNFQELYNMIPIDLDEIPTSMSKKGNWLFLYYVKEGSVRPEQFFNEDYFLYSVRIHKDTGQILRKGYNKGLTLTEDEMSNLEGTDNIENVIATGYFLDEPKTTIYYMRSSEPEDFVNNPAVVEIPYLGTTWQDGVKLHTREYMRDDL